MTSPPAPLAAGDVQLDPDDGRDPRVDVLLIVGDGIREAESAMTAAEAWWSRRAELSS